MTTPFQLIVSTDIVGALGNPNSVLPFWEKVGLSTSNIGLEVIAFFNTFPKLSTETISHIAGFHSRTTNIANCISKPGLAIANLLISPPTQILNRINKFNHHSLPYILTHNTYNTKLPETNLVNYVFENDNQSGALEATNSLSKSKNMVIDLFHISLSEHLSWSDPIESRKLLSIIEKYAPNCFAFHIPIGKVTNDSLPLDISDESITTLKSFMKKYNITPIIECQWGGIDSVYCRPASSPEKISYVKSWLTRLNLQV